MAPKGTPPKLKEAVRLETLRCVRAAKLLRELCDLNIPWAAAVPLHHEGQPTPFDLDEWVALVRAVGAQVLRGATTRYCPEA